VPVKPSSVTVQVDPYRVTMERLVPFVATDCTTPEMVEPRLLQLAPEVVEMSEYVVEAVDVMATREEPADTTASATTGEEVEETSTGGFH
jgi:hypothetical protein